MQPAAGEEVASRPWEKGSILKILAVNAPAYPYPIPDPFLVLEGARIVWMKEERERLEALVKEVADSDVKKFVLGSVSHAVAAHAPCSVEIVRCKRVKSKSSDQSG